MRERTYYPELCLVQVATDEVAACIDPLALPSLEPLLALLLDERMVKVLHAARQDLEIFFHLAGRVPQPVFDTQVAARFLGLDRKSTRLNSSHVEISYAVFCLKKKNWY